MIHYQLRCSAGHGFEGWFRDAAGFDDQSARGLLSCPDCGTSAISRGLMAPAVRSSRRKRVSVEAAPDAAPAPASLPHAPAGAVAVLPDQVRAVLQRMRAEIEQNCDDVGDRFAEVARAQHRDADALDAPARGIYGSATTEEYEALADEGIEVNRIPWLPRADS